MKGESYRQPVRYTEAQKIQFIKDDLASDLATSEQRIAAGTNVVVETANAETCRRQLKILAETPNIRLDQYGWPTCLPT